MSADSKALLLFWISLGGWAVSQMLEKEIPFALFLGAWIAIGTLKIIGCFKEKLATAERQEP